MNHAFRVFNEIKARVVGREGGLEPTRVPPTREALREQMQRLNAMEAAGSCLRAKENIIRKYARGDRACMQAIRELDCGSSVLAEIEYIRVMSDGGPCSEARKTRTRKSVMDLLEACPDGTLDALFHNVLVAHGCLD